MINKRGYRLSVGIILINRENKIFWGKRIGYGGGWQFPQGGLKPYETLKEAMYRELEEELGLSKNDVQILGVTRRWLYYKIPPYLRRRRHPVCTGQRQKWFLLRLTGADSRICLDLFKSPEFKDWRWVDYWYPINKVIRFKQRVYRLALQEFHRLLKNLTNKESPIKTD